MDFLRFCLSQLKCICNKKYKPLHSLWVGELAKSAVYQMLKNNNLENNYLIIYIMFLLSLSHYFLLALVFCLQKNTCCLLPNYLKSGHLESN